ncbi:hypothetical protein PR048_018379 [Dryococelus australis]|uniref:Uncharacterized protein n=1 Tax=Dryococelus australis TaxID=614101 RepID=A0ABQ9HC51_9NEOP|nr:hypothetical protein PR048_018379 [Dryococelus australis]
MVFIYSYQSDVYIRRWSCLLTEPQTDFCEASTMEAEVIVASEATKQVREYVRKCHACNAYKMHSDNATQFSGLYWRGLYTEWHVEHHSTDIYHACANPNAGTSQGSSMPTHAAGMHPPAGPMLGDRKELATPYLQAEAAPLVPPHLLLHFSISSATKGRCITPAFSGGGVFTLIVPLRMQPTAALLVHKPPTIMCIVLEDLILSRKENHHVRVDMIAYDSICSPTFLGGHTDVHPCYATENVTLRRRLSVTNQQRSSRHTVEQIPVVFIYVRVLAWVVTCVYTGAPFAELLLFTTGHCCKGIGQCASSSEQVLVPRDVVADTLAPCTSASEQELVSQDMRYCVSKLFSDFVCWLLFSWLRGVSRVVLVCRTWRASQTIGDDLLNVFVEQTNICAIQKLKQNSRPPNSRLNIVDAYQLTRNSALFRNTAYMGIAAGDGERWWQVRRSKRSRGTKRENTMYWASEAQDELQDVVEHHFSKRFQFEAPEQGWRLPDPSVLFKEDAWQRTDKKGEIGQIIERNEPRACIFVFTMPLDMERCVNKTFKTGHRTFADPAELVGNILTHQTGNLPPVFCNPAPWRSHPRRRSEGMTEASPAGTSHLHSSPRSTYVYDPQLVFPANYRSGTTISPGRNDFLSSRLSRALPTTGISDLLPTGTFLQCDLVTFQQPSRIKRFRGSQCHHDPLKCCSRPDKYRYNLPDFWESENTLWCPIIPYAVSKKHLRGKSSTSWACVTTKVNTSYIALIVRASFNIPVCGEMTSQGIQMVSCFSANSVENGMQSTVTGLPVGERNKHHPLYDMQPILPPE